MAIRNKIHDAARDVAGMAEEAAGNATDNEQLATKGKDDQIAANPKKAGEDLDGIFE